MSNTIEKHRLLLQSYKQMRNADWSKSSHHRVFPRFPALLSCFALALFLLWPLVSARAQVISQRLASVPLPGEYDTAAARGGQAGGRDGFRYQLTDLRCGAGQAIVGANLRRGDALDYLQLACATPVCNGGTCQWSAAQWGPSAGNPSGGDAHPAMMCAQTQAVSGFRARVVTFFFRTFDYAEDVEIECSQIVAAPTAQGYVQVASTAPVANAPSGVPTWHHPEGSISLDTIIQSWRSTFVTSTISCARRGWAATAFSLGVSDFVSSRVVQAVSLYCPRALPQRQTNPNCPTNLTVAQVTNDSAAVQQQWFQPSLTSGGGRTAGGSVATMQAQPMSQNFNGTRITETVALDPTVAQCPVPNAALLCGNGTGLSFTLGDTRTQIGLPNGLAVPWNPPGGQHQNSFADLHFVFDSRANPQDLLTQLPHPPAGGCRVTCTQTYSCGTGASATTYGPFQIVYTLVHGTWRSTILGVNNPLDQGKSVTLVTATKH
jgi:hypothetical protein